MRLQLAHRQALEAKGIGETHIRALMQFKASERKDDPARRPGLHGPYEELVLMNTGRLPDDYFTANDPEPWGLRIEESRSNILWQVLSGLLDTKPDFAAAYMGLALDRTLNDADYARELGNLHKDWRKHNGPHVHHNLGHAYRSVACPACSVVTALACRDAGMHALFQEMLPLSAQDRRQLLQDHNLTPLLNVMIPTL